MLKSEVLSIFTTFKIKKKKNYVNVPPLLFPEEANIYDHCQHLYARQKKKYTRPEEVTDHYHNLGATFGPICERCETLEVPTVLIFMFFLSPHWPSEETRKTAVKQETGVTKGDMVESPGILLHDQIYKRSRISTTLLFRASLKWRLRENMFF